jgi:hypothetical protein
VQRGEKTAVEDGEEIQKRWAYCLLVAEYEESNQVCEIF